MRGPSIKRKSSQSDEFERFTVRFDASVARRIRQMANDRGTTAGILIREFVLRELERMARAARRRPRDNQC